MGSVVGRGRRALGVGRLRSVNASVLAWVRRVVAASSCTFLHLASASREVVTLLLIRQGVEMMGPRFCPRWL